MIVQWKLVIAIALNLSANRLPDSLTIQSDSAALTSIVCLGTNEMEQVIALVDSIEVNLDLSMGVFSSLAITLSCNTAGLLSYAVVVGRCAGPAANPSKAACLNLKLLYEQNGHREGTMPDSASEQGSADMTRDGVTPRSNNGQSVFSLNLNLPGR